jgi:hypothetical protein
MKMQFSLRMDADGNSNSPQVFGFGSGHETDFVWISAECDHELQVAQDKVFQVQVERLNPRSLLNPHRCIAQGEINLALYPSLLRDASEGGGEQHVTIALRPGGQMVLHVLVRVDRCDALRASA